MKRGDERQRGENLDRKGEQFTENIPTANKHMKPSLPLLSLRTVYMCKNVKDTFSLIRRTKFKNFDHHPVLVGFGEGNTPTCSW